MNATQLAARGLRNRRGHYRSRKGSMPKVTFFPLGNADCCRIDLKNGKKVLFDYAAKRNADDKTDKRIDLAEELRDDLDAANRDNLDIVALTHLDDDHTHGAEEFFHLDHAKKYQSDDRIKIDTLWVPANVITESSAKLETGSAAIQAEARHRLKKGYGIRVFSRPEKLKKWLSDQGLTLKDRKNFITDAGNLAPELTLAADGVEFFVHSPFGWRQDESTVVDRNGDSLVMQATFLVDGEHTKLILGSDVDHTALTDIVAVTKSHKNEVRLKWHIFKLPHHCSYLTLGPERGEEKTKPVKNAKWLFETQGQHGCYSISTSDPIPAKGSDADESDQPPHRQAANYYRDLARDKDGEFLVTMEHPDKDDPQPLEIEITKFGGKQLKRQAAGASFITGRVAPRAG
jgi:beta-lactamase superfamily II metal-dependent hydrolase